MKNTRFKNTRTFFALPLIFFTGTLSAVQINEVKDLVPSISAFRSPLSDNIPEDNRSGKESLAVDPDAKDNLHAVNDESIQAASGTNETLVHRFRFYGSDTLEVLTYGQKDTKMTLHSNVLLDYFYETEEEARKYLYYLNGHVIDDNHFREIHGVKTILTVPGSMSESFAGHPASNKTLVFITTD